MAARTPVELVRQEAGGVYSRVGNRVQLEGADGEAISISNPLPVTDPFVTYLGAERLTLAAAAQTATIPATTENVLVAAEGGDIRWIYNGNATATSAGYIPAGTLLWLSVPSVAPHLSVYGAIGAFANLVYTRAE